MVRPVPLTVLSPPASLAALMLAVVAGSLLACAPQRELARSHNVLMSTAEEEKLGDKEAESVAGRIGFYDDEDVQAYVQDIGERIARNSPRREIRYRFHVVEMVEPNAFALPGGHIYVSRGLLTLVNSEEELANVLAHEVAHVALQHHAYRELEVRKAKVIGALATLIGALAGGPGGAMVAAQTGMGAAQGMIAAYGRDQERESDSMGQALARDAGWDPLAMASFLAALDQHSRLERGSSRRAGYFDTHPGSIERLTSAAVRYEHETPLPDDERGREDYLEEVDGMVVGQNPAEGFFVGGRFIHPTLGFTMRFPDGWHTANEPAAVRAISPQGNAMVILEMQGKGNDPEAAAREYSEKVDAPLSDTKSHRTNGNPSFSGRTRFDLEGSKVKADITWIAHRGRIYRIMGVLPSGRLALGGDFGRAARSFRRIGASEADGFRITRLRVTEAKAGETLDEISLRSRNQWVRDETAVMNGRHVDAPFEGGELVKIAVSERWVPEPLD
ncbi:MAG: M48 family metalloprotease [Deltaproteobacteria bacterium]|nr:M48 family metalloprotease [Deltaproteobacteria bacterium]MBW2445432.1 M48 family metalloprotease [Deltaproteobacteria bacterium]